jgi:hypothetical protein
VVKSSRCTVAELTGGRPLLLRDELGVAFAVFERDHRTRSSDHEH